MRSDVRAFVELGFVPQTDHEDEVLERLIRRRLVLDQVDRFVVAEPEPARVDQRLAAVRERVGGDDALAAILDRVGLTLSDLRQMLADDVRRDAYLLDRFAAVDSERRPEAQAAWVDGLVRRAQIRRAASSSR